MNIRVVLVATTALAAVTGCTVPVSGGPEPGAELRTSPSSTEPSDPTFANLLPPRPRDLDLTGVDPCVDLFTNQQLRELDYDLGYARPGMPSRNDYDGGPGCTFASTTGAGGPSRNVRSLVGISTTEGALVWVTDPSRAPRTRPEVVNVQGFHALVLPHPVLRDNCLIIVDTAEGQHILVQSSPDVGDGPAVEPFCQEAARVGAMAIQTISASR